MSYQDWKVVTLTKDNRKPQSAQEKNQALQSGQLEAQRRQGGNAPGVSNVKIAGLSAQKVDAEEDDFRVPEVGFEFKMALQKARQAKGWTQKELAEKIAVKASVITDYESGNAIPDPGVIGKLGRALGVQLPKPPKKKVIKE